MRIHPLSRLLLLVAAFLCANLAPAGAVPPGSARVGGATFVGPTSAHPSSIYYNPAALTQITDRHRLVLVGSLSLDDLSIARDPIDSMTGEPSGAGDRVFEPVSALVPTPGGFFGGVHAFGDHRIAWAFYTPYFTKKPEADGIGYHTMGSSFATTHFSLAWALRVTERLSIGVAVGTTFRYNKLRFLRDRGLEDCPQAPCAVEDPRFAEQYRITSDNGFSPSALSFHTGFLLVVPRIPNLIVGMSYASRAAPVGSASVTESADATVTGFEADGLTRYELTGKARIKYSLPQSIFFGARYLASARVDLVLNCQWSDFSRHDEVELRLIGADFRDRNVPELITRHRGYRDAFSTDAGFEWDATTHLRLATMLRFESKGVDKSKISASQIDGAQLGLGLGAQLRLSQAMTATLGYSLGRMFTQTVDNSDYSPTAYNDCVNSGYDIDRCLAVREGRAIPTAAGTYNRMTHQLSLGLTWQGF